MSSTKSPNPHTNPEPVIVMTEHAWAAAYSQTSDLQLRAKALASYLPQHMAPKVQAALKAIQALHDAVQEEVMAEHQNTLHREP